jgi:hypothetical protein
MNIESQEVCEYNCKNAGNKKSDFCKDPGD